MHHSEEHFARLARSARRVPDDASSDELPPALATSTLALLRAAGKVRVISPWERLAPGAVALAAIAAAIFVFSSTRTSQSPPHMTTIACPPRGRLPVSTPAHPNKKIANARWATS